MHTCNCLHIICKSQRSLSTLHLFILIVLKIKYNIKLVLSITQNSQLDYEFKVQYNFVCYIHTAHDNNKQNFYLIADTMRVF